MYIYLSEISNLIALKKAVVLSRNRGKTYKIRQIVLAQVLKGRHCHSLRAGTHTVHVNPPTAMQCVQHNPTPEGIGGTALKISTTGIGKSPNKTS